MIPNMIPILYYGAPGIGKTAYVRSQFDYCEILLLSSMTEEDISGLPFREGNNERRTTPFFVERINAKPKKESICLFLDELDKARREVADTLLTLITNPSHFGIEKQIHIIAAANPPEWGGGDGISQAMMSRFCVIPFSLSIEKWCEWAQKKYSDPRAQSLIANIKVGKIPILEEVGEGYNWRLSCPRTIDMALQVACANQLHLVKGLVTANVASAFQVHFSCREDLDQDIARTIAKKATIQPRRIFQ